MYGVAQQGSLQGPPERAFRVSAPPFRSTGPAPGRDAVKERVNPQEKSVSNVVKLFHGRIKSGKKIPKPVECKDCGDPIEAARLQAFNDGMAVTRCISCARAQEKRFNREMVAVRDWQSVEIIRR